MPTCPSSCPFGCQVHHFDYLLCIYVEISLNFEIINLKLLILILSMTFWKVLGSLVILSAFFFSFFIDKVCLINSIMQFYFYNLLSRLTIACKSAFVRFLLSSIVAFCDEILFLSNCFLKSKANLITSNKIEFFKLKRIFKTVWFQLRASG